MMYRSLFVYGVLGVLLVPVWCDSDPEAEFELITVCIEEDEDLRVDCRITPKLSQINSYEFSWSNGSKENVINTNVSGSSSEPRFKDQSYVEELEPHGYRMTLEGFTEKLPHNTTFMCKITKKVASAYVERDNLVPCSAVSIFLKKSCIWIWVTGLLLYLSHTGS